jgi:triosephosphate isomerase
MKIQLVSFLTLATATGVSSFACSPLLHLRSKEETNASFSCLYERKPFITGNWKLNPGTKEEAIALAKGIAASVKRDANDMTPDVALFVPFPFIETVQKVCGDAITVGAEMCTPELKGAFTGGISPVMLKSCGVQWALAGHSERRTINQETDEYINAQCLKLMEQDMNVILCVGETLSEYNAELAGAVCEIQLKKGLAGVSKQDMDKVCIAYEPVWAIGTGKVATPEIAQEVHAKIRSILANMYGQEIADNTRVLYGGSVTDESVDGLMAKPDIDGCLVGGASLDATKFGRIINFEPIVDVATADGSSPDSSDNSSSVEEVEKIGKMKRFKNKIKSIFKKEEDLVLN